MKKNLLFLIACLSLCISSANLHAISGSRPNIIFYLADDQNRYDHSTYGNDSVPTPVTDAFSKESLVFNKGFTGQGICAPSRSILLSGLYPLRNGCFINHTSIRGHVKTLPHYLKDLGYDVILAGKSHIKPFDQFPWTTYMPLKPKDEHRKGAIPIEAIDDYIAKSDKPFCLIIASDYPHGPYIKGSGFKSEDIKIHPGEYDSEGHRNYLRGYYASIDAKEREFDSVLNLIEKHEIRDDTIVFYADDHGRGRGKFTVYDMALNVAFMVRWPSHVMPGRSNALVSFVDFVPTAIELAGGNIEDAPYTFDGKSLIPILNGSSNQHHPYVYGVAHSQGIQNRHVFPQRSIHDGRYHYTYNFNSKDHLSKLKVNDPNDYFFLLHGAEKHPNQLEEELYDTFNDPFELENLAYNKKFRTIKKNLKVALFEWMQSQDDFLSEDTVPPFFKVWGNGKLDLDIPSKRFKHHIPENMVGVLESKKIEPHSALPSK